MQDIFFGKKSTYIKFGRIVLPVKKEVTPFIPKHIPYAESRKILETLAYSVRESLPVLLIGETGVGKTSAVRYLASKTNNSLRRVNVNGSMTAEDFVGQLLVNEKGTYWKDGVLTEAMRNGYWIVIDEINAASAEILFVLHSLLDDDGYIVLAEHPDREIVKPHPDFRVFATMNPPERYAGTKELNKALLSRFPVTLTVEIPIPSIEYGILSKAKANLDESKLGKLKLFVSALRASYDKEEIEVFVSPRDVATIVRLHAYTQDLAGAVEMSIVPRGTKSESKMIRDMARLYLSEEGKAESPTIAAEMPVKASTASHGIASSGV